MNWAFVLYGFGLACILNFVVLRIKMRTCAARLQQAERLQVPDPSSPSVRHITFIHPDLGIGGAERLIVDAAVGLQSSQSVATLKVLIITSHHDPTRAFHETVDGTVKVEVRGDWLPNSIFGGAKVLCASLRAAYAAIATCYHHPETDCFVVDQVAFALPFLAHFAPYTPTLFYCHFPDQHCDPNRMPGGRLSSQPAASSSSSTSGTATRAAKRSMRRSVLRPVHERYRSFFDRVEAWSMAFAGSVVCNSKFSHHITVETFPSLASQISEHRDIFYPPVVVAHGADEVSSAEASAHSELAAKLRYRPSFVSINRYERKKNIALAIRAFAELRASCSKASVVAGVDEAGALANSLLLVIAGGYDPRLSENVAYDDELQKLAMEELHIPPSQVLFLRNISDAEKRVLLKHMTALIYTPSREHFGIVPVEAMSFGKPVVAVADGGPCESVGESLDDAGGLLCPADASAFAGAMRRLLMEEGLAERLGSQGRTRASTHFSLAVFSTKMATRIEELCTTAETRCLRELGEGLPEMMPSSPSSSSSLTESKQK